MTIKKAESLAFEIEPGDSVTQTFMRRVFAEVIGKRDAEIAAWCEQKAAAAQRAADAHDAQMTSAQSMARADVEHAKRRERCEGQASAFRAMAAMLKEEGER